MSRTLHFYNAFIKYNDQFTSMDVSQFINAVYNLNSQDRYIEKTYGSYSLIDMLNSTSNPNNNPLDRLIGIASYRDRKPFAGNRGTDTKNEITTDVFELTTCLFIPHSHLAIIEYNHFGIRPQNIERYFNNFLNIEAGWEFKLEPIPTSNSFTDISRSNEIKSIELKLDLTTDYNPLFQSNQNEPQSITTTVNQTAQAFSEAGANVASITVGRGRFRNRMEFDDLLIFLRSIDTESENLAGLKVKYVSPTTGKTETVDLKNEGVLKRVIDSSNNAFESIAIEMSDYYYNECNNLGSVHWQSLAPRLLIVEEPTIRNFNGVEIN